MVLQNFIVLQFESSSIQGKFWKVHFFSISLERNFMVKCSQIHKHLEVNVEARKQFHFFMHPVKFKWLYKIVKPIDSSVLKFKSTYCMLARFFIAELAFEPNANIVKCENTSLLAKGSYRAISCKVEWKTNKSHVTRTC